MYLKNLVGKKVIRTKPYMDKNIINDNSSFYLRGEKVVEIPDYSFCECNDVVIEVIEVVQDVPIVRIKTDKKEYVRAISGEYNDENWKDVTEVYKRLDEIKKEDEQIKIEELRKRVYGSEPHLFDGVVFPSIFPYI